VQTITKNSRPGSAASKATSRSTTTSSLKWKIPKHGRQNLGKS
jgi:hypothetical protein